MRYGIGGTHHGIAGLTPEGLSELGVVGKRPVRAPPLRRVRIGRDPCPLFLRPRIAAPALRIPDEKPLLRRKSVDEARSTMLLERLLERVVAGKDAAVIGDVLALSQL